ncbi:MAG: glycosyltransferase family 39 protein [Lachnospiraceae bacterium]|nr:glycosyltransferase family 39 protein [Lachnospiraceae bacterium]
MSFLERWNMFMEKLKQGKFEIFIVVVLLFGGIFIRAFHFGISPVGIHQDEAMAAVDALALSKYGTDRFGMPYPVHFTAWGYGQMSVLLSYFMVPFIKIMGFSIVSVRLPMLVISSIGLMMLYFVARKLYGVIAGYVALLLGCVCPWHYMQSRWSLDCNMFPHIFIIGVVLLMYGLKKRWMMYLSMVFFALCSYCYGIANYSVPLFLLVMAIVLCKDKIVKTHELIISMFIYLLIALPEFLVMIINLFGLETIETPLFTIPYFPESVRSNDILFMNFSFSQLLENIGDMIAVVWGKGETTISATIVEFGPLYHFTVIFFLIGLVVAFSKMRRYTSKEEKMCYVILLAWFFMGIWIGIMTNGVLIHRINVIFYSILLLAAVGICWCIEKWKLLVYPIVALYGVSALLFLSAYFGEWTEKSRDFYFESYVNALNYAKTLECDYYHIFPDPQWTDHYELGRILTMFCHEIDAEYFQGITNVQDGKEVLPFDERYTFEEIDAQTIRDFSDKSIVYLINGKDLKLFSQEEYEFVSFYDSYYVVSRK